MSELIELEDEVEIGVHGSFMNVPIHLCFETFDEIDKQTYPDKATLKIGNLVLAKDAP